MIVDEYIACAVLALFIIIKAYSYWESRDRG